MALVICLIPASLSVRAAETSEKTLPAGTAGYVMDVPETEQFLNWKTGTTTYFEQYHSRFLMKDTANNAADPFNATDYGDSSGGLYIRKLGGETFMLLNPNEVVASSGVDEYVDGTANKNPNYGKIQRCAGFVNLNNISTIDNPDFTVDGKIFDTIDDAVEESVTHLAFRIKVVGGTKDQLSAFQMYYTGASKLAFDYPNTYFVDMKTKAATKNSTTSAVINLPCGNFDGYMLVPMGTALANLKTTGQIKFYLENSNSDYYNYSNWTGRTLCLGDVFAVTDYDAFVAGIEAPVEETVVNSKNVLTVPAAGGKISFNNSYDDYTNHIYNCGMPNYPQPNFMKSAVSVTVDGENFFPYTVSGDDKKYSAGNSKYYTLFKPANYTLNIPFYVVTDGVKTSTREGRYPISDVYSDASDYSYVALRFKALGGTENSASTMSLCVGPYAKDAAGVTDLKGVTVINFADNTVKTLESGSNLTVPYNFDGWYIVPSASVGAVTTAGYIFYPDESDSWLNKNLYFGDIKIVKDADAFVSALTSCEVSGGHSVVAEEAQAPSNESVGHIAHYVCSKCSKAFEDSEGKVETNPERLAFNSASLSLYQNIVVNFKVRQANLKDFASVYAKFTVDGQESIIQAGEAEDGEIVFALDALPPDMFGETITAQLFGTYSDGKEYSGSKKDYSIKQYCLNKLSQYKDSEDKDTLKTLLVDILNYGAAAQIYNETDTDNLVNGSLTVSEKLLATKAPVVTTGTRGVYDEIDETATWNGVNLQFESTVALKLRFTAQNKQNLKVKITDAKSGGNLLATIDRFSTGENGSLIAYFDGLDATQMRTTIYATVYNGDTQASETLAYDIVSYAAQKIAITQATATEKQKNLRKLVIEMMKYGESATAYFVENSDGLSNTNGTHLYIPYTAFATDMGTFRLEGSNKHIFG
ncbi:MAG: hypothetical protein IJ370_05100, partial [Oscillospiraceae bacterium]|nr:hypothetical protein [Oscillospiraceae bacterium]